MKKQNDTAKEKDAASLQIRAGALMAASRACKARSEDLLARSSGIIQSEDTVARSATLVPKARAMRRRRRNQGGEPTE